MELKATEHRYYCNDGNYHSTDTFIQFDTWEEFKEAWLDEDLKIDHDYNHCFRFDIKPLYDHLLDREIDNRFSLHLYIMQQRKGNFIPIEIKEITEKDMDEVGKYLRDCWEYLKCQWIEFGNEE